MIYWITHIFLFIPFLILYPIKKIGKNFSKIKGGHVVVCNHIATMDPAIVSISVLGNKYFLAKKELFKNKFISWILKSYHMISVDRQNPGVSTIKNCLKVLKENKKLIIFPEGTRNKIDTNLQQIKNGACLIAIKAKKPILPMHIISKPKILRKNTVAFGKPIYFDEFYDKKLTNEILDAAGEKLLNAMKALYE